MWLLFACCSSVFAGATSILAKAGLRKVDSTLATALRTGVVLIFAWIMVLITGATSDLALLTGRTLLILILSGLATGASWLCFFYALQIGPVGGVAALDKSSTVITIILAFIFFQEPFNGFSVIAILLILAGTLLMVDLKNQNSSGETKASWPLFAFLAALFAALTALLGKVGVQEIDSDLATAIRTIVILIASWGMVFIRKTEQKVSDIDKNSWIFLILSGCATGMSWLCYFRALQTGPASVVVPVDKTSIVFTILFATIFLKEKQSRNSWIGLILLLAGTLVLVFNA